LRLRTSRWAIRRGSALVPLGNWGRAARILISLDLYSILLPLLLGTACGSHQSEGYADNGVIPRRRAISGYRANNLEKFRRALEGEQFAYACGYRPIIAQRFSFPAINISRTSGLACISSISSRELAPKPAFAMIQPSTRWDSELVFPSKMAIPRVGQIGQPAGNAKNCSL